MRNQKGFTLIELIVIIVIIGILAAIAIPRYLNLTREAADGTAKGVLGALRSANSLLFGLRILGNTTTSYTMGDIAGTATTQGMLDMRGIQYSTFTTTFVMTVRGFVYTFTLNPTPQPPTTYGSITAGGGTFTTW